MVKGAASPAGSAPKAEPGAPAGATAPSAPTARDAAPKLLEVSSLELRFGGVKALDDVSLDVRRGEIFAVIGPNGAGKTSLLNSISGLYRPQSGEVVLHTEEGPRRLSGLAPHAIARLGVARSFQNIELFRHMTVLDNLMLGRHVHIKGGVVRCGIYWGAQRREEIRHRRVVEEVIDFLEIQALRERTVGTLAYGLQKRVELARALALEPELLLLDEPMAGMNVEEKEDIARFVLDINQERGTTVVLIEHDMGVVMDLSDQIAVLDFGRNLGTGTPEQIRRDPAVIRAYLGEAGEALIAGESSGDAGAGGGTAEGVAATANAGAAQGESASASTGRGSDSANRGSSDDSGSGSGSGPGSGSGSSSTPGNTDDSRAPKP